MRLDCFSIIKNEEEVISGMLDCFWHIRELIGVVSLIDNGSSDFTLPIVERYRLRGLPIVVRTNMSTRHHGQLRTQAIDICRSPWILYLDADETFTSDMLDWLKSDVVESADIWDFWKYSTIQDRYHFTEGGNGPSTRMFRNVPGVHFPQTIHTHPEAPSGLAHKRMADGPVMFDHTGVKSREALWVKGARYQWSAKVASCIGPTEEYVRRVDDAYSKQNVVPFNDYIRARIFAGPVGK